jgi:hypothetical protein
MEAGSTLAEENPYNPSPQQFLQGHRKVVDAIDNTDIRYWSDFTRIYYLPRSLQKLPDPPEWESTDLGWIQGHEMFTRHNEVDMNIGYQLECIDIDMIGCRTYGWIRSSIC